MKQSLHGAPPVLHVIKRDPYNKVADDGNPVNGLVEYKEDVVIAIFYTCSVMYFNWETVSKIKLIFLNFNK